ncbi:alpha/beta fold hydrolase [Paracoccus sp. S-4012]|uniref:alpha/beta hydrolase n=1 Tax=Paracoccus sp. S-4012 TaxID=2665648 RepID=UPI0012AF425E|nr:alpha/beta hydrolase [Paracoccus sp. S-4012]MRX49323.1 alpha/beta fold hydrolase [Paracoccus sp. S-4012]
MEAITDWDDEYRNSEHIAGGAEFPARWERDAAAFRQTATGREGIFWPEGTPRGLAVFVHGGYWMRFSPAHFSHLAAGPLARGWAVAMPGYTLAPEQRISAITRQVAEGIAAAAAKVEGPVVLSGHSAGGHLATRMLCADEPLPQAVAARVVRCVPVSGVFDLRPLLRLELNAVLHLDLAEARAESPALLEAARTDVPLTVWVGADERPEFLRQSALMANVWRGQGLAIRHREEPQRHHFDVIEDLADADSGLTEALVGGL